VGRPALQGWSGCSQGLTGPAWPVVDLERNGAQVPRGSEGVEVTTRSGVSDWRGQLREFLERPGTRNVILGIIIFNAITLGMSTSAALMASVGPTILMLDRIVIAFFVFELTLKLIAYGLSFFRNAWNVFDLFVVGVGLLPQTEGMSALRGLRVIRALRLLSAIPQMRAVVQSLLDALPGMGAVVVMLSIVYYVFAVMATIMYGADFPVWFGSLGASFYSLFQIMTLEGWSDGIVRPVMLVHPNAWLFFVPFIIVTAFSVLNLFIGLLVTTMQQAVEDESKAALQAVEEEVRDQSDELEAALSGLQKEIAAMRRELADLRSERHG